MTFKVRTYMPVMQIFVALKVGISTSFHYPNVIKCLPPTGLGGLDGRNLTLDSKEAAISHKYEVHVIIGVILI